MTASKSTKAAKYTYAERVLGAFSHVRKQRRKHTVHLATLRAQVKRNAQAKEDKLGPRWHNWVTKAVHRLENEGILAAAPYGSVVMTPTGKKAIAHARKSLAIASNTPPKSVNEEMLWKAVTHGPLTKLSARGMKRRRYSLSLAARDSEDELQSTPTVSRLARRKRTRTSLPTRKIVPRKSKVVAPKGSEAGPVRPDSPLTDLDDDDDIDYLTLKTGRDSEVTTGARRQLRNVRPTELDNSVYDGGISSSPTPYTQRQRPIAPVVRTLSGSFICDVSKRPTPAPTNSDAGREGAEEVEEDELFGDYGESVPANWGEPSSDSFTPSPTPASHARHQSQLVIGIKRLKAVAEEGNTMNDAKELAYNKKISDLEKALKSRSLENQQQKKAHVKLSEQITRLEQQVSDRDLRVSNMERDIGTLGAKLSLASSELVSRATELKELRESKEGSEASLATRTREFEVVIGEKDKRLASLAAENAIYTERLSDLEQRLLQTQESLASSSNRTSSLEEEITHAKADLIHARDELILEQDRNTLSAAMIEATLATREAELTEASGQLLEALEERALLEGTITDQLEKYALLEAALNASRASNEALETDIAGRNSKITELSEDLASAQNNSTELRGQISSLESSVNKLQDEMSTSTSNYTDLVTAYQTKCDECNGLFARIQEAEQNATTYSESLAKARAEVDSLKQSLDQVKADENTWREALSKAEASHEKLTASLSAEVKQLQNNLNEAKSTGNRYKEKSAELGRTTEGLRKELAGLQDKLRETEGAWAAAEAQQSAEQRKYESRIAEMEESLLAERKKADSLSARIRSVGLEGDNVREQLGARSRELSEARSRADSLEGELAAAVERAHTAEEETLYVHKSKEADEKTIEALKEAFAHLRETQMKSLEELGNKVHSAHLTPLSKRRLTSSIT